MFLCTLRHVKVQDKFRFNINFTVIGCILKTQKIILYYSSDKI